MSSWYYCRKAAAAAKRGETRRLSMSFVSLLISLVVVLVSSPLSPFPSFVVVQAFSSTTSRSSQHHHGLSSLLKRSHHSHHYMSVQRRRVMTIEHPLLSTTTRLYAKQPQQQQDNSRDEDVAAYSNDDDEMIMMMATKSSIILQKDAEEEEAYATGFTVAALIVAWSLFAVHATPFVTLLLSLVGGGAAGYGSITPGRLGLLSFILRAIGTASLQGVILFQERVVPTLQEIMSTTVMTPPTTPPREIVAARDEPEKQVLVVVQQPVETMTRDEPENVVEPPPLDTLFIEEQVKSSPNRVVAPDANTLLGAVLLGGAAATELDVEQKDKESILREDEEPKMIDLVVVEQQSLSSLKLEQQPEEKAVESMSRSRPRVPDATILGAAVTTSLVAMAVSDANIFVSSAVGVAAAYASVLPSNTAVVGPVGNAMRTVGEFAVETVSFGTEWADRVTQTLDTQWEEYQKQEKQLEGKSLDLDATADKILSFLSDFSLTMTGALHSLKESLDSTVATFQKNNADDNNKVVRAAGPSFFIDELSVDNKEDVAVVKMDVSKTAAVAVPRQSVTAATATPAAVPLFFAAKQQEEEEQQDTTKTLMPAALETENAAVTSVPAAAAAMMESSKETVVVVVESSKASVKTKEESNVIAATTTTTPRAAAQDLSTDSSKEDVTTTKKPAAAAVETIVVESTAARAAAATATTISSAPKKQQQEPKTTTSDSSVQQDELTRRALLAFRVTLQAREREQRVGGGAKTQSAVMEKSKVPVVAPAAKTAQVVVVKQTSFSPSMVANKEENDYIINAEKSTARTAGASEKQKEMNRRALLAYRLALQAKNQQKQRATTVQEAAVKQPEIPTPPAAQGTNKESTDPTVATEKQNEMNRRALLAYRLTLQANQQKRATVQEAAVKDREIPMAPAAQGVVKTQKVSTSTVAKERDNSNKESSTAPTAATDKQNEMNRRALLAYRLTLQVNEQQKRAMTIQAVNISKVATAAAAKAQAVYRAAPPTTTAVKLEETVMVEPDVVVAAAATTPPPPQDSKEAFKMEIANGKSTEKEESAAPTDATKVAQVVVKQVPSPMAAAKLKEISAILESARDTGSVPASMQLEVVNAILTEFPEEAGTNGGAVSPETTKLDQITNIILEVRNKKAGPASDTGAAAAEAQLEEINAILATTTRGAASTAGAAPKVKGQKSKKSSSKSPNKKKKKTMSMSTE